jgi:catalase
MSERRPPTTTTDSGIPVASDEHSLTVGPNGPTVLHDAHLVQKMQHFNRQRFRNGSFTRRAAEHTASSR